MTYRETLRYLFEQLPMYQRIGPAAYKPNLDNTVALCKLLGNPEEQFVSIHVAGTNGKGSVSHMIASVLQANGYKVGLYTSPHLKDFRERIRINGKMISEEKVIRFVQKHKNAFKKIHPSFFEMTVGLAFDHFAKEKVDIAVIETGLGGRLDSTNVIIPVLSVVTNISFDHTSLLGNTLKKIAAEKAGIIKPGRIAIIGEKQKETDPVFIQKAKEEGALLCFAEDIFKIRNVRHKTVNGKLKLECDVFGSQFSSPFYPALSCDLPGFYQEKNILTSLGAIALLEKLGGFNIAAKNVRKGFASVRKSTGLRGRWEILSRKPLTVADTGHNEAGIKEIIKQIHSTPHKKLHIVFGAVNDKDISSILKLLPKKAAYYFCKADIPRALDENELLLQAKKSGLKGNSFRSVKLAVKAAQTEASPNDLIFIGGSTFVAAEAL